MGIVLDPECNEQYYLDTIMLQYIEPPESNNFVNMVGC